MSKTHFAVLLLSQLLLFSLPLVVNSNNCLRAKVDVYLRTDPNKSVDIVDVKFKGSKSIYVFINDLQHLDMSKEDQLRQHIFASQTTIDRFISTRYLLNGSISGRHLTLEHECPNLGMDLLTDLKRIRGQTNGTITLVGYGYGAQIAGFVARTMKSTPWMKGVDTVYGLDPFGHGPCKGNFFCLYCTDADCVQIINTATKEKKNLDTVCDNDINQYNGTSLSDCEIIKNKVQRHLCSHEKAVDMFIDYLKVVAWNSNALLCPKSNKTLTTTPIAKLPPLTTTTTVVAAPTAAAIAITTANTRKPANVMNDESPPTNETKMASKQSEELNSTCGQPNLRQSFLLTTIIILVVYLNWV